MKVEIYGAEHCSFCKQAVKLCETKSIEYNYIDVDTGSNLSDLIERMGLVPRTIPQIFVDGTYIPGGYTGFRSALAKMVVEDHDYNEPS